MTRVSRRKLVLGTAALAAAGAAAARALAPSGLAPGEIAVWYSYGGKNRQTLLELVDAFHRAQSAVRVRATFQGDYFEGLVKLRTGLYVGAPPTLSHVVGEVLPYLEAAAALSSFEPLGEALADLHPALDQHGTFAGDDRPSVAIPFNRSTPIAYYNRAIFDELDLEPPASWDALRETARRATRRRGASDDRWGFECPIDWWFWVALVGQAGGELIEADGRVSLGDEAGARALGLWQAMLHDDGSMKPPPGRDYDAWEATNRDFLAGRVAMIWTSTAFLRYLEEHAPFPLGVAALPGDVRRAVPTGGTFWVMPRGLSEAERSGGLAFLRWMIEPAQANAGRRAPAT
jgi:sn-glycerol 3-phosphate transport system substrate-binding protein